jgi:hypothetical protein
MTFKASLTLRSFSVTLGVLLAWIVSSFVGPWEFQQILTTKWQSDGYWDLFFPLLVIFIVGVLGVAENLVEKKFVFENKSGGWPRWYSLFLVIVCGAIAGSMAGLLAIFIFASLENGSIKMQDMVSDSGGGYLLLLAGISMLPFTSWFYGILAALIGNSIEKTISSRIGKSRIEP